MVEIDYSNMPPQMRYKIDLTKITGNYHKTDELDVGTRIFGGNDMVVGYLEGSPGQTESYHTHDYNLYQLFVPIQGRVKVYSIDNDGSEHSVEAGPEEVVYLPPGATNKYEVVGDERLKVVVIRSATEITRPGQILADESGDYYDPQSEASYELEIDTLRGNLLQRNEETTEEW